MVCVHFLACHVSSSLLGIHSILDNLSIKALYFGHLIASYHLGVDTVGNRCLTILCCLSLPLIQEQLSATFHLVTSPSGKGTEGESWRFSCPQHKFLPKGKNISIWTWSWPFLQTFNGMLDIVSVADPFFKAFNCSEMSRSLQGYFLFTSFLSLIP